MRRKLQTRRGRKRYALRMETGASLRPDQQGRGFRQFLFRGLEKVQGEWSLICTGHNPESSSGQALLKLFRFGLPANTGGPKPGRLSVYPPHWLRSTPPVSQPTTRHPSYSLGR